MSRKSRALKKVREPSTRGVPVTKIRGPADVVVMVPYLLGFQPHESLVLVSLEGPRNRFGPVLRVDVVPGVPATTALVATIVAAATTNRMSPVLMVLFSERPDVADPLAAHAMAALSDAGVEVVESVRADGQRWWSYICSNPDCCSPDGMPYDAQTARVAAEAVIAGLSFEADRDALRALFDPASAEERIAVARAVATLRGEAAVGAVDAGVEVPRRLLPCLEAVCDLAADDVAWLGLAVESVSGKEAALGMLTRERARDHFELWRTVVQRVPDDLVPGAGGLAACSAWLDGRGVVASHAVDRVLEVDPTNALARAIGGLLTSAINPRTWTEDWSSAVDDGTLPIRRDVDNDG